MSGTGSYRGRARKGWLSKQNSTFWMGIGRTTPWDDEEAPPAAPPGQDDIEEPIVYVQVSDVRLCKQVYENPDYTENGKMYQFVDDANARVEHARWIYFKADFDPNDGIPTANYRQKGIFADLVPAAGHEGEQWLAPANVDSVGDIEYISNTKMRTLGPGESRIIQVVMEHR